MTEQQKQGWWWPFNSRKSHYYTEVPGRSLCGKWLCVGKPELEDTNHGSPDNCLVCQRKRKELEAKQ